MKKSDFRFFDMAAKIADKSPFKKQHVGCVAVYKGYIVSQGVNSYKSHPEQKRYDRYRSFRDHARVDHALHAEIDCLTRLDEKFDMSKIKLFIYRPRKDIVCGNARPCPACLNKIKDLGIKKIFYTTDSGYAEEVLF